MGSPPTLVLVIPRTRKLVGVSNNATHKTNIQDSFVDELLEEPSFLLFHHSFWAHGFANIYPHTHYGESYSLPLNIDPIIP